MSAFRIAQALGVLLLLLAVAMLLPAAVAASGGDRALAASFALAAALTGFVGAAVALAARGTADAFGEGEGLACFALLWIVAVPFAALPLYAAGKLADPLPSLFNVVSALTTTGASVDFDPTSEPFASVLWLFLLGWLGGFVSIVAAIALLTRLDIGGLQMLRPAVPRGEAESLLQGVADIARRLSVVYCAVTAAGAVALSVSGLSGREALLYALGATSTSGLPVRADGSAPTASAAVAIILAVCMLAGACNPALLIAAAGGRWRAFGRGHELHYLLLMTLLVALLLAFLDRLSGASFAASMLDGLFLASSAISTTGYGLEGGNGFLAGVPILLLGLALVGGAAGSASGGMKLLRVAILFKQASRELSRLAFPHGVVPFHLGEERISAATVRAVWSLFYMLLTCLVLGTLLLALLGVPPTTAMTAMVASLSNAGPMLPVVDPAGGGYAGLPDAGKLVLMLAMVLGRVELLAFVTVLSPAFWRR